MSKKRPLPILPVLPLRDVVVFPFMVIPLFVGRKASIAALEAAVETGKKVLLVAQKDPTVDEPSFKEVYHTGTIATILQLLKLPDGTVKVLVEGISRAKIAGYLSEPNFLLCDVTSMPEGDHKPSFEVSGIMRALQGQFERYVKSNRKIPSEVLSSLSGIESPVRLVYTVTAHMSLKIAQKQEILEITDTSAQLNKLLALTEAELELVQVEKRLRGRVKSQMEDQHKRWYLKEQREAIQKELEELEGGKSDLDRLGDKIKQAGMSKEAKEKSLQELDRLKLMPPMAAEASVSRNYIDWMLALPWKKQSKLSSDLLKAEQILDDEHYGLIKVKERIVEYLAVQQRMKALKSEKKQKASILCLVGPPGVGKTSLGRSIAHATNREYVRMALGGVRDEAEIRGHRRTYVGALPGKIIQKIAKSKVKNPLFLLDEIDKMAMDFRGDPASALLEVLDPEQNSTFNDHYLEVDYDLSDVFFIATANSLKIPAPLLDRMEVIRLAGYTEDEKREIALKYIVPKQMENNGLNDKEIDIKPDAVMGIIRYYTREAGVRNLEREISKICRKVVTEILLHKKEKKSLPLSITEKSLEHYLGVRRFRYGVAEEKDQVGQVNGLAWTEVGGELLTIEATKVAGKGKTTQTGQLGNVMQESIKTAMTVVRSRALALGIPPDFYEKFDVHVHVPEGATPKDGPSAGIGMCTALVSAFTEIPVRADVAMTGEITLRGEVLPIGGLKEKLLAAHRAGIKRVIVPEENRRDLKDTKEIPQKVQDELDIHPVKWIDDVLELALLHQPSLKIPKAKQNNKKQGRGSDDLQIHH